MGIDTPATEELAQAACKRGDYAEAARAVLEAYGAEVYSFLLAQFRGQEGHADDVFSDFSEDFWRGLPKFEWRCSVRAWCYRLARSAASRFRRSPHNRGDRRVPLTDSVYDDLVQRARTSTSPHLRSEVKDEFQQLREKLSPEDRDLLTLRVDRDLSWRDVAHAMAGADDPLDEEAIRKLEAALRQRFTEVKRRLRKLADESGLLDREPASWKASSFSGPIARAPHEPPQAPTNDPARKRSG